LKIASGGNIFGYLSYLEKQLYQQEMPERRSGVQKSSATSFERVLAQFKHCLCSALYTVTLMMTILSDFPKYFFILGRVV